MTVHRIALAVDESELGALAEVLSPDERARAACFHRRRDRERFVIAHGRLRHLLASHGAGSPAGIALATSAAGKPRLASGSPLRFNLSHSGDVALVAVTIDREIGVDVERIVPRPALRAVAERFFAPAEVAALAALDSARFVAAFHRCWTRKEAYVKARGVGLTTALDSFDVVVGAPPLATSSLLLATRPDVGEIERWRLEDISVGSGYVAALAYAR